MEASTLTDEIPGGFKKATEIPGVDLDALEWKAPSSVEPGQESVLVATLSDGTRLLKDSSGGVVKLESEIWGPFIQGLKAGEFQD